MYFIVWKKGTQGSDRKCQEIKKNCFTSKIVIDLSGDCKDLVFNTRLQKLSVNDVKDLVRLHIPPRVGKTQHKAVTGERKNPSL